MRHFHFLPAFALLLAALTTAHADDKAAKPPGVGSDASTTDMRTQTLAAKTFFYAEAQVTLDQVGETAKKLIPQLLKAAQEGKAKIAGPVTFVMQGATEDKTKPFTLQIGFPVAPGATGAGDLKVRPLDAFKCAALVLSGPVSALGDAYQKLYGDLVPAGYKPTGEMRQLILYWEGEDSPNNVVMIAVGIE